MCTAATTWRPWRSWPGSRTRRPKPAGRGGGQRSRSEGEVNGPTGLAYILTAPEIFRFHTPRPAGQRSSGEDTTGGAAGTELKRCADREQSVSSVSLAVLHLWTDARDAVNGRRSSGDLHLNTCPHQSPPSQRQNRSVH